MTGDLLHSSINILTILMRMKIVSCVKLENINSIFGANFQGYYYSLENRLANKFQHNIFLIPVIADGNCLFQALSHIIFGAYTKYECLHIT